jgi:hypothetical protein
MYGYSIGIIVIYVFAHESIFSILGTRIQLFEHIYNILHAKIIKDFYTSKKLSKKDNPF